MSADFGYINARVRGLKSRLLGPEFFTQALSDSNFSAFLATLAQTDYMADLEEAQSQSDGLETVDRALARNFWRITRSILNFTDGWPHELVAVLLMKYDLANLKAVVRAQHAGRSAEDTKSALLPAGQLKPAVLDQLTQAADVAAVAQVFSATGHPLAEDVRLAARAYQADDGHDLFEFELGLDRAYTRRLLELAEKLPLPDSFRDWLRLQADSTNLLTALKMRGRELPPADLFVDSGRGASINRATFQAIASDENGEGVSYAAEGPFKAVAETTSLNEADAVVRQVLDERVRKLAVGDPLGPFVILDYLRRKEGEVARLRLLARGKFYSVPRERLEKELGSGNA